MSIFDGKTDALGRIASFFQKKHNKPGKDTSKGWRNSAISIK
jgi:hypothetical protein